MTEKLLYRNEGHIWWLIFNQPEKKNAISSEMSQRAAQIVRTFDEDKSARVLVVAGAGDEAFVSGADISELPGANGSERLVAPKGFEISTALKAAKKPTIAMIKGYCLGGGVALAASCDLRFCSDDASFGIPAARLGIMYPFSDLKLLIDLVGPAHAKEIMYTARRYAAVQAQAIGLVNAVLPKSELENHVRQCADTIANNSPLSQIAAKVIVDEYLNGDACDYQRCEKALNACFESEDFRNATRAFIEKRKPVFKGS